jgi:hypothetical protein
MLEVVQTFTEDFFYFSIKSLLNYKFNSILIRALLKYGYSKFKLEILEYCEPNRCLEIEQNYINLLNPEYNILKKQVLL